MLELGIVTKKMLTNLLRSLPRMFGIQKHKTENNLINLISLFIYIMALTEGRTKPFQWIALVENNKQQRSIPKNSFHLQTLVWKEVGH